MTKITNESRRVGLRAFAAGSALCLITALGAQAPVFASTAPSQDPSPSQSASPAPASPTSVIDQHTITITGKSTVETAKDLSIPVSVKGAVNERITLQLRRMSDHEVISGTDATVTIGQDGAAQAAVPAGSAEPGAYVVTSADQLSASGAITVKSAKDGDEPGTQDDALDKYYPELAKETFDPDGDHKYTIGAPKSGGASAGIVPRGLGGYYSQKIDFSASNCTKLGYGSFKSRIGRDAECGYMISPIDAKNPKAGNIAIAVMKVKAGKIATDDGKITGFTPTKPQGSMMWNPGGPGGSGMTLSVAGALYEPDLAEHYDMIGFDPRGTGGSMPYSQCSTDEQQDKDRASNSYGMDLTDAEKDLNTRVERTTKDCFANTGKLFGLGESSGKKLMQHLGTWDAVGDLDQLRSIAGDTKLNYLGFSYGTRLGYVYAQKFQKSAGRLVLDGVVDPGDAQSLRALKAINAASDRYMKDDSGSAVKAVDAKKADGDGFTPDQQDNINQGAGFQNTFEQYALDCSAKGAQKKTYGELWPDTFAGDAMANETFSCALGNGITDAKKLSATNAKLLQTLEKGDGLPTGNANDERVVTFADGRQGVFEALYSEDDWGTLNAGLNELKAGKSAGILMTLADSYSQRDDTTGHYEPMIAAFTNIRCTDSNSRGDKPSIESLRKFTKAYDDAAPFQAASTSPGMYDYCDFWKFKGTLPGPEKLTKVPNVLVVSTTHDPATPYAAGVKVARLIDGTLLSASGSSHTSYMSGDPAKACVDETVNTFMEKGIVPGNGEFGEALGKKDTAKDDLGKTVTLTKRCKVETFRAATFTLSNTKAHAGDRLAFRAQHQASEAKLRVKLGTTTVKSITTDNGGNASGLFTVPKKTKPGTYRATLVNASGTVLASKSLTVLKASVKQTDEDTPKAGGESHRDPGHSDNASDGPHGPLPRTGTEVSGMVGFAVLLLAVGAVTMGMVRRRRHSNH